VTELSGAECLPLRRLWISIMILIPIEKVILTEPNPAPPPPTPKSHPGSGPPLASASLCSSPGCGASRHPVFVRGVTDSGCDYPKHPVSRPTPRTNQPSDRPIFNPQLFHLLKIATITRQQRQVIHQANRRNSQIHRPNADPLGPQPPKTSHCRLVKLQYRS
jgi:hypothetical protein